MAKTKPLEVRLPQPHPFIRTFPRLSLAIAFIGAVLNLAARAIRAAWPWRRELTAVTVVCGVWWTWGRVLPVWPALAATLTVLGALLLVRPVRAWIGAWLRGSRTRRLIRAGLAETRTANPSGRLPRIVRVVRTPVGERLHLALRAGQSAELLDARVEELRAAVRARDVRITRDPHRSHRVLVDVVRRDPLAAATNVTWADQDADVLSMWQPVHLGVAETGEPVRLSLVERSLLVGGEPGSGKSSLLNVIAGHAAQSPDAHLLLIDPNEVQFGPWQHRALAYASDDPIEALDVLELLSDAGDPHGCGVVDPHGSGVEEPHRVCSVGLVG